MRYYKIYYFGLFLVEILAGGFLYGQKFVLTGNRTGNESGLVILSYLDDNFQRVRDTAQVINGKFRFEGFIKGAGSGYLINDTNYTRLDGTLNAFIFLEPGQIQIEYDYGNIKDAIFSGSQIYHQLKLLKGTYKTELDIVNKKNKLIDSIRHLLTNGLITAEVATKQIDQLSDESLRWRNLIMDKELHFLRNNPNSFVSLILLDKYAFRKIPADTTMKIFSRFPSYISKSTMAYDFQESFRNNLESINATYPFEKIRVNETAPSFIIYSANNDSMTLASFNNKVVLIEFWSLTCLPCLEGNIHLEEMRKSIASDDFIIIGVAEASLKSLSSLISYIQLNGLKNWIHVSSQFERIDTNSLITKGNFDSYQGTVLPRTILINKKSEVIYKSVEYSEKQVEILSSLIKKSL